MANNRMWIKNRKTGNRVLLAKYYPSTGWYIRDGFTEKFDRELEKNSLYSQWGNMDWEIEYEMAEPEAMSTN